MAGCNNFSFLVSGFCLYRPRTCGQATERGHGAPFNLNTHTFAEAPMSPPCPPRRPRRLSGSFLCGLLILLVVTSSPARADDFSWNNASGGNWSEAAKWDRAGGGTGVPGA